MRRVANNWKNVLAGKAARLLAGAAAVFVALVSSSAAIAQDVYIVDTVDRDESRLLGASLQEKCAACGTINYVHMGGNMRAAQEIADQLKKLETDGRLSLVVTLGKPATRIIADKLEQTPILYTLVGAPIAEFQASNQVTGFPTDAPIGLQLELLREMAPSIATAGIVLSERQKVQPLFRQITNTEGVKLYLIGEKKEMPEALRQAVRQNDAVIFLRDSMVINKDTIRFLLQYTLENGRHTLGYSKPLVDMGFAAALVPKPAAFGELVGNAAQQILNGEAVVPQRADRSFYDVHLNERVLNQLTRRARSQASAGGR